MRLCPRCGSNDLEELAEGSFICRKCGYVGDAFGKGIIKS